MSSIADLDRVLGWMLAQGLQSVSLTEGEAHLTMKLASGVTAPTKTIAVKARAMGAFLPEHPRRRGSAIKAGDTVAAGATVGFLQVGPTLVPVVTESGGRVSTILARTGAVLGYGAPVLELLQGG